MTLLAFGLILAQHGAGNSAICSLAFKATLSSNPVCV